VDLLPIVGLGKAPDVTVFNGMVELFVGPCAFCLVEGLVEIVVGLALAFMGGGKAGSSVGEVALIVPPREAVRVRVVLAFKGEVAGLIGVGIEGVEEGLEGALSSHRGLLWGVMIRMLQLDPLQA